MRGRVAIGLIDFTLAQQIVCTLQNNGELSETAVLEFAKARKYEEMVASLSALCVASIELIAALMRSDRNEGLLIASKSAGLKWPTVSAILKNRIAYHTIPDHELAQAKADYLMLSQATALRTLRFWQVRVQSTKAAS